MIERGDRILLTGNGRNYFVRAGTGTFSTDLGMLDLDQAVGKGPGTVIRSHTGAEFSIRLPRAPDFYAFGRRSGAPMPPKDIGLVIAYTGMNRKDRVLDAGTGSGIAAIYFGGIADRVVTYERREDFARLAGSNIRDAGLSNVDVVAADMLSADGEFEVVHLDMEIDIPHIQHAWELITPGGYLACYTPFFEHMRLVIDSASPLFSEVHAHECMEREMSRTRNGTRPSTRVGHSGYVTVARK